MLKNKQSATMASIFRVFCRNISTTSVNQGKKNPRKFMLYNKAGTREYKERRRTVAGRDPELPIFRRGVRATGITIGDRYIEIPEMIPELIVPDLKGCKLKPYVSYQSVNVTQTAFTAKDLFDAVYSEKITKDFAAGKLNENGEPLEPNEHELLTAQEAKTRALKTGCDLFNHVLPPFKTIDHRKK